MTDIYEEAIRVVEGSTEPRDRVVDDFDYAISLFSFAMVVDLESRKIVRATPMMERIFRYGDGELVGVDLNQLLPERLRESHTKKLNEFNRQPCIINCVGRMPVGVRSDGSEFGVVVGVYPRMIHGKMMAIATVVPSKGTDL